MKYQTRKIRFRSSTNGKVPPDLLYIGSSVLQGDWLWGTTRVSFKETAGLMN